MNILKEILAHKKQEVAFLKRNKPVEQYGDFPLYSRKCLSLQKALQIPGTAVIAEIKKASPSKGIIRENFYPVEIARKYVSGGAAAISILTDEKFFQGNIKFITDVRPFAPLPILRKDFIIDSYQITETKAYGADAVLLIAAALEPGQLHTLHEEANNLGIECLVEVHNEQELQKLDMSRVKIIGINNRNLADFSVDISTTVRVASEIPKGIVIVSESGISNQADIENLVSHGINAVLAGEILMRAKDPEEALRSLLSSDRKTKNES